MLEDLGKGGFQHLISLEKLSIENCEDLQYLFENELPTSLTSLRLCKLPKVEDLGKGGLQHLISLKKLSIVKCENLQCLSENGLPTSLTYLCLEELPKLEDIGKGGLQHLISLKQLGIGKCEKLNLRCLSEYGGLKNLILLKDLAIIDSEKLLGLLEEGLPPSLTSLWINGFQNLRDLNRMGFQHLISLGRLTIRNCGNLQCLPEQGLPSSLFSLDIFECPLLNPRCQKGTGSDWLKVPVPTNYSRNLLPRFESQVDFPINSYLSLPIRPCDFDSLDSLLILCWNLSEKTCLYRTFEMLILSFGLFVDDGGFWLLTLLMLPLLQKSTMPLTMDVKYGLAFYHSSTASCNVGSAASLLMAVLPGIVISMVNPISGNLHSSTSSAAAEQGKISHKRPHKHGSWTLDLDPPDHTISCGMRTKFYTRMFSNHHLPRLRIPQWRRLVCFASKPCHGFLLVQTNFQNNLMWNHVTLAIDANARKGSFFFANL
ncbi:hypothetical protein TIFTF001_038543 [Ficus carica]|uniref:Uncharacterized protein n=1 Tax=Ficus carica TaxID=3494 RepID=A0AA88EIS2_FICCA|nr:hypothetical protein TIFTF001_038543 [Ficus carica]